MPRRSILLLLLGALFAAIVVQGLPQRAGPVYAATFTVNSTNDNTDGSCNVTHCSFREAVIAANGRRSPVRSTNSRTHPPTRLD